jgi:hypothetical protein
MDDDNLNSKNASQGVTPADTHVQIPTQLIAAFAEFKVQLDHLLQQLVQQQPDRTAVLAKLHDEREHDFHQFYIQHKNHQDHQLQSASKQLQPHKSGSDDSDASDDSVSTSRLLQNMRDFQAKRRNNASDQNNNQQQQSRLQPTTVQPRVAGTNALKVLPIFPETVEGSKQDVNISPFTTPVSNRK